MARVTDEQRLNFERAVFDFLSANPSSTTQAVGEALYDQWKSPGPVGSRPKSERATDWAKRKLKNLAKSGKVYQPTRGQWVTNVDNETKTFSPISIFKTTSEEVVDNSAFTDAPATLAGTNSPFIRGLLRTAERHGSVELSEPLLHALIEEMTMLLGEFNN